MGGIDTPVGLGCANHSRRAGHHRRAGRSARTPARERADAEHVVISPAVGRPTVEGSGRSGSRCPRGEISSGASYIPRSFRPDRMRSGSPGSALARDVHLYRSREGWSWARARRSWLTGSAAIYIPSRWPGPHRGGAVRFAGHRAKQPRGGQGRHGGRLPADPRGQNVGEARKTPPLRGFRGVPRLSDGGYCPRRRARWSPRSASRVGSQLRSPMPAPTRCTGAFEGVARGSKDPSDSGPVVRRERFATPHCPFSSPHNPANEPTTLVGSMKTQHHKFVKRLSPFNEQDVVIQRPPIGPESPEHGAFVRRRRSSARGIDSPLLRAPLKRLSGQ